jgi:hypothetical protein
VVKNKKVIGRYLALQHKNKPWVNMPDFLPKERQQSQPVFQFGCLPTFRKLLSRNPVIRTLIILCLYKSSIQLVGTTGFEPATTCPPDKCATKLRYAPIFDKEFKAERIVNTIPCNLMRQLYYI